MYASYVLFDLLLILILYMVMLGDNIVMLGCRKYEGCKTREN